MTTNRSLSTLILIFFGCISLFAVEEYSNNNQSKELSKLNKFADYIEESIQNGNPSFLNKSFDFDLFMQKICSDSKSNSESEFKSGFQEGFKNNFDIGSVIINEIQKNGSYTFLHSSFNKGTYHLLFRLMSDNGINYHEYEIKLVGEEPRIVDIFLFQSGEKISESVGDIYKTFLKINSKNSIESNENQAKYAEIEKFKNLISKEKYKKAFTYWLNLSAETRHSKSFLVAGLQLASRIDEEKFNRAFTEFQQYFPDNKSKYLIPLEGLVGFGKYSTALSFIDSLDQRLEIDPMLNFLRAKILSAMGNQTESANKFNLLIQALPDFENGYIGLLQLYIIEKDFIKATEVLDKMVSNLDYYKSSMNGYLSNFPEFYQSNEFQVWLKQ